MSRQKRKAKKRQEKRNQHKTRIVFKPTKTNIPAGTYSAKFVSGKLNKNVLEMGVEIDAP